MAKNLRPIDGKRTGVVPKKPPSEMVRVIFMPDETGYGIRMVECEDLLPRRLRRAIKTTIPEDALGNVDEP